MSQFDDYWTFRVLECGALVASHPNSEGLFILNETAAWIWENASDPDLVASYAHRYGLEVECAEEDVSQTTAHWQQHASLYPLRATRPQLAIPPESLLSELYRIEDTVLEVRYHSAALIDEIRPRLRKLEAHSQHARHVFDLVDEDESSSLFIDGVCVGTEAGPASVRIILLQEMARLAVPARDFEVILHAGAVGNTDHCIVLAGRSFSGKSTLTAALMQSGLLCYSDDSAALTTDYRIAGLPFSVSLREGSWHLFPQLDRPRFIPSNLGNKSPLAKPIGIVFVNYDPDAASTTLAPVDRFQTLVELQQSGFWVRHTQPSIRNFLDWVSGLPSYRLSYSDLASAVTEVRRLLSI